MARLKTLIESIASSRVKKMDLSSRKTKDTRSIGVATTRFRAIQIITSDLSGVEDGALSAATFAASVTERVKVKKISADRDALKDAIKQADVVLIAGDYPLPVKPGKTPIINRARFASNYATKKSVLMYYVGEPYMVLVGGRTPQSLGFTLSNTTPHHLTARFGSEKIDEIVERRFLRVVVVGPKLSNSKDIAESRKRSSDFFTALLKAFLTKPTPPVDEGKER